MVHSMCRCLREAQPFQALYVGERVLILLRCCWRIGRESGASLPNPANFNFQTEKREQDSQNKHSLFLNVSRLFLCSNSHRSEKRIRQTLEMARAVVTTCYALPMGKNIRTSAPVPIRCLSHTDRPGHSLCLKKAKRVYSMNTNATHSTHTHLELLEEWVRIADRHGILSASNQRTGEGTPMTMKLSSSCEHRCPPSPRLRRRGSSPTPRHPVTQSTSS